MACCGGSEEVKEMTSVLETGLRAAKATVHLTALSQTQLQLSAAPLRLPGHLFVA